MDRHADKAQHQANRSVAASLAGHQDTSGMAEVQADRRPQFHIQRKQLEIMNNSPKNRQLRYFQAVADRNEPGGTAVTQLLRTNSFPPGGEQVIQRWPVKVGMDTLFYPENDMDNPKVMESGKPFELEESDLDNINEHGFILIKIGDEKGWISYAHIMSVGFETALKNKIEAWNTAKQTELFNQPILSARAIACFDLIKNEIEQTSGEMEQVWGGTYLFSFEQQLNGYERVLEREFKNKVAPTIRHYFGALPVNPHSVDQAVVKQLNIYLTTAPDTISPETKRMWTIVRQVSLQSQSIQDVYAISGNPAESKNLGHREAKITPQDAYRSDNRETEPGPESKLGPKGKRIQTADSRDKLTGATGKEQVYVRHIRDTRPGHVSIFINNTPTSDDVAQTGIGDCYYLAVVASIADRDPGRIRSMFSNTATAGPLTVNFYFKGEANDFFQQPVTIDQSLVYDVNTGDLAGNRFKILPTGTSRWVLKKTKKGKQHIVEERYYQTALWAPLLEKAFARFAEMHGKYGMAFSARAENKGYENIVGGRGVHRVFEVFYGDKVQAETVPLRASTRAGDMLDPHNRDYVRAIQMLLRHQDARGDLQRANQVQLLTASAGLVTIMQRAVAYIDRLKKSDFDQFEGDSGQLAETQAGMLKDKYLEIIRMIVEKQIDDGDPRIVAVQSTAQNYTRYLLDFIYEGLGAKRGSTDIKKKPSTKVRHLMQLLLDLLGGEATLSTQNRQRYIYTQHEYAVLDVRLVDKQNKTIRVDASSLKQVKAAMPKINILESTVTLRNPHHANRPDFYGKLAPNDAGRFTMKLSKFLRNFDMITSGVAQKG